MLAYDIFIVTPDIVRRNNFQAGGGMMRYAVLPAMVFASVALMVAVCYAYPVPSTQDATLVFEEKQLVADREPPTEILIRTFNAADGSRFRTYSVGGNVFRYDIDEDDNLPYEYRLVDNDGDGEFETREAMTGGPTGVTPGEKYFIDLGREPGKEYKYSYEDEARPLTQREQEVALDGYPIYIPTWVLVRF